MYNYTDFDRAFLKARVVQFDDQVERRIGGALTEDEFRPLRLMNGLYQLLHAYMLRVAIPYGTLNSRQMHKLADIADRWDKGYGHFTTRQNIQYHWPKLRDVPKILAALAEVDMHAVQTSGPCIRAITADHLAGAAVDELADPRPTAELLRQWSSDHNEFAFLPRKFKIAVTGSETDRAVIRAHDIGIQLVQGPEGEAGYKILVGGGLGRTPMIAKVMRDFLPRADLLPYVEAILQVYNQIGRRDNKYKARIKITVHELGIEAFREQVEARFILQRRHFDGSDQTVLARIEQDFTAPEFLDLPTGAFKAARREDPAFRLFADTNLSAHKHDGYAIVSVSLKKHGATPGDASSAQMRALAEIAKAYAHDELRVSHEQNIVLPHVPLAYLPRVYAALRAADLATANIGLISDMIACPGMDYCDLATARSIPLAQQIARRFDALKLEHEIGHLKIKISGCVNACGHHHVGHIGILGLEKSGIESYQITLGGEAGAEAGIGRRVGPGFSAEAILPAIETLIKTYLALRLDPDETFHLAFQRLGMAPFRAALYPDAPRTPLIKRVPELNRQYRDQSAQSLLTRALKDPQLGRTALVSSFGAESVVLLHLVATIAPDTPVLFVDTGLLFPETLKYQKMLAGRFGLSDLRILKPDRARLFEQDPENSLHQLDTDTCCALRKIGPLQEGLKGFDAWITGRKRYQGGQRQALEFFENEGDLRIKINPLAHWSRGDMLAYIAKHDLPRHPLVQRGYPSIGCAPCTTAVAAGEPARAGRWRNLEKTECGIHFPPKDRKTGESAGL